MPRFKKSDESEDGPPLADQEDRGSDPAGRTGGSRPPRQSPPPERLFTPREIADLQQVHQRTVTRWIASGALRALRPTPRIVRVTASAYREFLFRSEIK